MVGENHLHHQQPYHLPSVPLAVTDLQTAALQLVSNCLSLRDIILVANHFYIRIFRLPRLYSQ